MKKFFCFLGFVFVLFISGGVLADPHAEPGTDCFLTTEISCSVQYNKIVDN